MRPDSVAASDRFATIRRANRRRSVSVVEAFNITPHLRRVVLRELDPLAEEALQAAEWIKLHVPASTRQHGRAYTIGARSRGTLALDMAVHDGLCSNWALRARPGDRAEISGPRRGFKIAWPSGDVLLGADQTGLPAVASILARLPRQTRGAVWVEVPHEDDIQPLVAPPAVTVRFLTCGKETPGRLLAGAMRGTSVSSGTTVWVAAERAAALDLREHFETVLPREQVSTSGYWRMPCHTGMRTA